jgi:hypothetical protein
VFVVALGSLNGLGFESISVIIAGISKDGKTLFVITESADCDNLVTPAKRERS